MRTKSMTIWVMVLMLIFAASVRAEVITIFDSNATIVDGNTYDTVVVKGDGTVVDMSGGTVTKLITMNASTFNMSGGSITTVYSYDLSVLNLSSGTISTFRGNGKSRFNISGNANISSLSTYDSSFVSVSGNSTIGAILFEAGSAPVVNIAGGHVNNLVSFGSTTRFILNISGGTTVNTTGLVRPIIFTSRINIIGHDLNVQPYRSDSSTYGEITGYWNDDTPFSIEIPPFVYTYVVLYDGIIPPNCVNKPNSDLSGDCKVNFKDFSEMAEEWLDCGLDPNSACNE